MLEQVSPSVRRQLAAARAQALSGSLELALTTLSAITDDAASAAAPYDLLAARLLRSEILYLDGRGQEAFDEIENATGLLSGIDSAEVEMSVRRNASAVATSLLQPTSSQDFYSLVDQQRLAGINLRDTTSVLDAKEAAEKGKHYDTLPALWGEYERTFRQGCWPIWHWAANNLACECIQVGALTDAAIFAVYSLYTDTAEKVGKLLLHRGNKDEIKHVVRWITRHAHLWHHHTAACLLIAEIADAINDAELDEVFKWLLRGCSREPQNGFEESRVAKAWEAAEALSPLLKTEHGEILFQTAISHSMWTEFSVHRPHLRHALGGCVLVLPEQRKKELLANLTEQVPLPTKTEEDLVSAVNLLVYAASLCSAEEVSRAAEKLYPSGQQLPWVLVAAADKLKPGKSIVREWDKAIESLVHAIQHQVQHLKKNEEPIAVAYSVMQHTQTRADGESTLIHIQSLVPFEATIKQAANIPVELFVPLVQAMLDTVANTHNLISNRIQFVKLLGLAAEHLTQKQRSDIFSLLKPMAEGTIASDSDEMTREQAIHPLNRYRIAGGTLAEVRAVAIQTLFMIEKAWPGAYGSKLNGIIGKALRSSDKTVRQFAMWAWAELPKKASRHGILILLATRDFDPATAALALEALGATKGATLSEDELQGLIDSCRVASLSPDRKLRSAAAHCLMQVKGKLSQKVLHEAAEELLGSLRNDICHSVRRIAAESEDDADPVNGSLTRSDPRPPGEKGDEFDL
jgi:hypothetical protein